MKKTEPLVEEQTPWQKLIAAQAALEEAERSLPAHDWLSARQKYSVLDDIDETIELMLVDLRRSPGRHLVPPLPDLTPTAHLLLAELRGRLKQRLSLERADEELHARRGD